MTATTALGGAARRAIAVSLVLVLAMGGVYAKEADAAAGEGLLVTPFRVLPLGDSLTWGVGASLGGGYRLYLQNILREGRYSSDLVGSLAHGPPALEDRQHEGHPGYYINDILRLATAQLQTYRPRAVTLMVGTNDILNQHELDDAPARLAKLIDEITATAPDARLIVASIPPLADPGLDVLVRAYNAEIPGIVQHRKDAGKRVSFVNMYDVVSASHLVADGVHLNDEGYRRIAEAWVPQLRDEMGAPPPDSGRRCPCSIWADSQVPATPQSSTTTAHEVGLRFRTEKAGYVTGIRFYKGPGNTGTHTGSLWTREGALLARATFTNETASGWQQVQFTDPVAVAAHTTYVASYFAPNGRFASDPGYFADTEVVSSPLRAPSAGMIINNGWFRSGSAGFPTSTSGQFENYWVDVVFDYTPTQPTPLDAPTNVTATAVSTTGVDLTWDDVAGETGYRVERSLDMTSWAAVGTTGANVTTHNDTGLTPDTTYHYRVIATKIGAEDSPPSNTATAKTQAERPAAPTNLTATAGSPTAVNLTWSDVAGETGYRVERSLDMTTWAAVGTTGANVTTYNDTGLTPDTTYHYRVIATKTGAEDSPPSNTATAKTQDDGTPPTAPSRLKATAAKNKVNLSWSGSTDAGGSGLAGYRLWRSTSGAGGGYTAIATTTSASLSDTTVTSGVTYWYRVTAYDHAGNQSAPSNEVSAQPK